MFVTPSRGPGCISPAGGRVQSSGAERLAEPGAAAGWPVPSPGPLVGKPQLWGLEQQAGLQQLSPLWGWQNVLEQMGPRETGPS